jgi:hypothetical protein
MGLTVYPFGANIVGFLGVIAVFGFVVFFLLLAASLTPGCLGAGGFLALGEVLLVGFLVFVCGVE